MTRTARTFFSAFLCTTTVLVTGPAAAHDGPHQLTYLQSLLHELAYADALPAVLSTAAIAAIGCAAAWRLSRRRTARHKM